MQPYTPLFQNLNTPLNTETRMDKIDKYVFGDLNNGTSSLSTSSKYGSDEKMPAPVIFCAGALIGGLLAKFVKFKK